MLGIEMSRFAPKTDSISTAIFFVQAIIVGDWGICEIRKECSNQAMIV